MAQLVYDVTARFCDRYIDRRSRTLDQMVQAARSGVQNISEGSQASGTSKKTELRLTNVARASLEELKLDYEDFLRQRGQRQWDRNDPRRRSLVNRRCTTADAVAEWVKEQREAGDGRDGRDGLHGVGEGPRAGEVGKSMGSIESIESIESMKSMKSMKSIPPAPTPGGPLGGSYAEIAANAALVLVEVACSLLGRQLEALGRAFEKEGGFTERLYEVRRRRRGF